MWLRLLGWGLCGVHQQATLGHGWGIITTSLMSGERIMKHTYTQTMMEPITMPHFTSIVASSVGQTQTCLTLSVPRSVGILDSWPWPQYLTSSGILEMIIRYIGIIPSSPYIIINWRIEQDTLLGVYLKTLNYIFWYWFLLNCILINLDDLHSIPKWISIPNLVENDTLHVFLHGFVHKLRAFKHYTLWTGVHLEFDISRPSEVKSDFSQHLKIKLVSCRNPVRNVMLFSKSAQSACYLLHYLGSTDATV